MSEQINPLQQYFRRPAIYMRLPSNGEGYIDGSLEMTENGELPIYPMTTIDEITSRTPDALFNGTAIVEIIKSCVPNIKDPWGMSAIDIDPILIAIRAATVGNTMEIATTCTNEACNEESKYDIALPVLLSQYEAGDYKTALPIDELQIKFRPLTYKEMNNSTLLQFEIQRGLVGIDNIEDTDERSKRTSEFINALNDMTVKLMVAGVEYIKTPTATVFESIFVEEFLKNCDRKTYNKIKDKNVELRSKSDTKPLQMKCMHCNHEYEQNFNINISTFFE
jgi:hypothetical protein